MINKVTITGADDNTPIAKMIELSKKHPFVEWGILFSPKRIGEDRYPSHDWIKGLADRCTTLRMNFSAHLCGSYTSKMLYGDFKTTEIIIDQYSKLFSRYQLNFNAQNSSWTAEFFAMLASADSRFILQFNKSNLQICEKIINKYKLTNVDFLYDASGGNGILPEKYEAPIADHYTGYAGGLSPDNIEEAIEKINTASARILQGVWIDTESGVRTDGKLDMDKVDRFLAICAPHIGLYKPVTFTFFPKKENPDKAFDGPVELNNEPNYSEIVKQSDAPFAIGLPNVFADENGCVPCPYCLGKHQHGGNGNGVAMGPRAADCGKGEYNVVPKGKKIPKQIQKINMKQFAHVHPNDPIGTCLEKINEIIDAINPL